MHNVTKSVTPATLTILVEEMSKAYHILTDLSDQSNPAMSSRLELGILSLFVSQSPSDLPSPTSSKLKTEYGIYFSLPRIITLLSKVPALASISDLLPSLDLKSHYVLKKLQAIILRSLVIIMEEALEFQCTSDAPVKALSFDPISPDDTMSCDVSNVVSEVPSLTLPQDMSAIEVTVLHKRSRDEEDSSPDDDDELQQSKRDNLTPPSIDILDQYCYTTEGLLFPSNVCCLAYTNSWRGRRFKRRHEAQASVSGRGIPLLQFSLSAVEPASLPPLLREKGSQEALVWVLLNLQDQSMALEFSNFFAFFKKLVFS